MRAERHAALVELAECGKRHDLEAAGIGQDRAVPVHEFVQPAKRGDALGTGPQHQVIGIAEQDLGAGVAHIVRRQRLSPSPAVPTGMKAGVCTLPCGVMNSPRRAAPSVEIKLKEKGPGMMLTAEDAADTRRRRNRSDSRIGLRVRRPASWCRAR